MPEARVSDLDFLRGISDWFAGREAKDGSIVCPRHRIEHSGKVVYAAAIDLALWRETGDATLRERMRKRALRALAMVRSDPKSGASVFFPGSLDSRNAASNLIDSGACTDVLAELLGEVPDLFTAEERRQVADALHRVCRSYLLKAVLVKEVPAQRMWGATGLARCARTLDEREYADVAKQSVLKMIEQANPDGSIPYMPEPQRHGEHDGLADISTFYHSRHLGFAAYVYRVLEEDPPKEVLDFLRQSFAFLCALYGRDGIKPLVNEAKQWYWESPYEVCSHSFDVHALLEGHRLLGDAHLLWLARRSYDQLLAHVLPEDKGVTSHHGPEINFQCRDFWNGHVAWIARVLKQIPASVPEPPPLGIASFGESGIVQVERADYAAMLRGRKQPINISFGGEAGGGSLLYFGRRDSGFANQVKIPKWSSQMPGNFVVTPEDRPSFKQRVMEFYRDNRHDMRFRLYVANIERKAGNTRHSIEYPLRHVVEKLRDEMKGRYSSHFDVAPSCSQRGNEIVFSSMLARRDGAVLRGSSLTRRYLFGEIELEVDDTLVLDLAVRAVVYECIASARDLKIETDVPHRRNGDTIMFTPRAFPATIRVTYRL